MSQFKEDVFPNSKNSVAYEGSPSSSENLISELVQLGLTRLQARIYVTALTLGRSSAASIAKNVSVDRGLTYRIIDGLTKLGMLEIELGMPNLFIARDPHLFIEARKSEYEARAKMADYVASNLEEIQRRGLQRSTDNEEEKQSPYRLLRNRKQFIEELVKLLVEAKSEILWAGPPRLLAKLDADQTDIKQMKELAEKGVSWFGITDITNADPPHLASVSRYCKIRHHRSLAFTLIVIDRRIAAFGSSPSLYCNADTVDEPYVFVEESIAARAYALFFESLWKDSKNAALVQSFVVK